MVSLREIPLESSEDKDVLFKFAKKLSDETKEEIDSSTFITVGDALIAGSPITVISDLPRDDSEVLRDFILV